MESSWAIGGFKSFGLYPVNERTALEHCVIAGDGSDVEKDLQENPETTAIKAAVTQVLFPSPFSSTVSAVNNQKSCKRKRLNTLTM